jgi:hypothetical protein
LFLLPVPIWHTHHCLHMHAISLRRCSSSNPHNAINVLGQRVEISKPKIIKYIFQTHGAVMKLSIIKDT